MATVFWTGVTGLRMLTGQWWNIPGFTELSIPAGVRLALSMMVVVPAAGTSSSVLSQMKSLLLKTASS